MSAFKRSTVFALAGFAVAATAALAAGPASAAPEAPRAQVAPQAAAAPAAPGWTISRGGLVSAVAGVATVKDVTAGQSVPCYLSAMTVRLKAGKKVSGSDAGSVTAARFGQCTLPHGIPVIVKLSGLPWHVNLGSYDAAKGVTAGTLTGLHLGLSVPLAGCSALADGTGSDAHTGALSATYSNKTGVLTADGANLRLYAVKHCNGLINDGDRITLNASYKVAPRQTITGP